MKNRIALKPITACGAFVFVTILASPGWAADSGLMKRKMFSLFNGLGVWVGARRLADGVAGVRRGVLGGANEATP